MVRFTYTGLLIWILISAGCKNTMDQNKVIRELIETDRRPGIYFGYLCVYDRTERQEPRFLCFDLEKTGRGLLEVCF